MTSIAFSRNGKRLAAGTESGRAIVWNVDPDAWRDRACEVANRNLSCREWKQFLDKEPYGQLLCAKLPEPADMAGCRIQPGQAAAVGR